MTFGITSLNLLTYDILISYSHHPAVELCFSWNFLEFFLSFFFLFIFGKDLLPDVIGRKNLLNKSHQKFKITKNGAASCRIFRQVRTLTEKNEEKTVFLNTWQSRQIWIVLKQCFTIQSLTRYMMLVLFRREKSVDLTSSRQTSCMCIYLRNFHLRW